MVSEQFKQNIKKYGREIDAKLTFNDFELDGTDIVKVERIYDADFMTTTMQEVNGELNGRHNLTDKEFTLSLGVKPQLETTNQIDKDFSGLRLVGDDLVQTMTVEPNKIYNFYMDILNTSHEPMSIGGLTVEAGQEGFVEDTVVIGPEQTTYDLVISGENLHFVAFDPHFVLDNRFIPYEYIELGRFTVVEHERKVDAQGDDKTTFKAFDHMIKAHEIYDPANINIQFPITTSNLIRRITSYLGLTTTIYGANLSAQITEDYWAGTGDLTYRNILDEIAQILGAGAVVFDKEMQWRAFNRVDLVEIDEDDLFSLKLGKKFGPVNIIEFKDTDSGHSMFHPTDWGNIPAEERVQLLVEDNQVIERPFLANLIIGVSTREYYPFEATTQGVGYIRPLDSLKIVDMDGVVHKSIAMHSTLTIDGDIKEVFKAGQPTFHKDDSKVVKPEDRKFNRTQSTVNRLAGAQSTSTISAFGVEPDLVGRINELEKRLEKLEGGIGQ